MDDPNAQVRPDGAAHAEPDDSRISVVRRLGRYVILERLRSYGMVQPYLARRAGRVELCVLKRLLTELEGNATARARFHREAKIAAHLAHPNVVKMLEAGVEEGAMCISFEWMMGASVEAILERLRGQGRGLPLDFFGPIALGALKGVGYAHAVTGDDGRPLGVVHRDLAPRNLMVSFSGEVKVSDFGVARASVDDFKTVPGMAVGTIEYMSPEQVLTRPIDGRSDLYTLAVVFYEMLSSYPVVASGPMMRTLSEVARGEPTPLAALRPDLSPRLVAVIERGLSKDPDRRWPSAEVLHAELSEVLGPHAHTPAEALGDFIRNLVPEEEQRALELMERVRITTETADEDLDSEVVGVPALSVPDAEEPPFEVTQVVRERTTTVSLREEAEPAEPSVMTMPGAPVVPVQRLPTVRPVVGRPRSALAPPPPRAGPSRRLLFVAGVAAFTAFGLSAWVALRTEPAMVVSAPVQVAPAADVTPQAEAARPSAARANSPQEAKRPPAAVPGSSAGGTGREGPTRVERPPAARESPGSEPDPKLAREPPKSAREPSPGADGASKAVREAVPPPPEREKAPRLESLLAALRASPKDARAFEKLRQEIATAAEELPPAVQRSVKSDLDAAERTFDLELLARALQKLRKAS